MTLFERVFGGNDYNYARTVAAIDEAIAAYGESEPVSFPGTAYSLPCYYGVTGVKITTLGEMKAAMDTIKSKMTRNNRLYDAFESGIASALCAEFLEALKYLHGAGLGFAQSHRLENFDFRSCGVAVFDSAAADVIRVKTIP